MKATRWIPWSATSAISGLGVTLDDLHQTLGQGVGHDLEVPGDAEGCEG